MSPPAPCHTRDPNWNTKDLLWEYLHQKTANHDQYKIVLNPNDTNPDPDDDSMAVNSKIPWNQRNPAFVASMQRLGITNPQLACGAAVKLFLQKYMKTFPPTGEPWVNPFYQIPPPASKRYSDIKFNEKDVKTGVDYIKKLLMKGIAVRIPLIHTSNKTFSLDRYNRKRIAANHYVGIVGYDGGNTFLYADPWPGFSGTYKYALQDSKFLGVMKYDGHMLKPDRPGTQAADCVAIAAPTWVPKQIIGP